MIAETAKIYPKVKLGKNVTIEDFCIVGAPFPGGEEMETIIGDDAVIRSHTVIYAGNRIGDRFRTGNGVNVRECNEIGSDVSIGTHSVVEHHVVIQSGVRIHSLAFVPEYSVLEEGCWIGPSVTLTNAKYPRSPEVKKQLKGPRIAKNAKIGAQATILPGVVVGENALVGAGSVVTKDIASNAVCVGNPARVIREIDYVS